MSIQDGIVCVFCENDFGELHQIEDRYNHEGKSVDQNRLAHLSCVLKDTRDMFNDTFFKTPINRYNDNMLMVMDKRLNILKPLCKTGSKDDTFYQEMNDLHTIFTGVVNLKQHYVLQH